MLARPPLSDEQLVAIPPLVSVTDLAPIFRVSRSRAYQMDKAGRFDFLLAKPAIPPHKFSGYRLRRWLQGEDLRPLSRIKSASGF